MKKMILIFLLLPLVAFISSNKEKNWKKTLQSDFAFVPSGSMSWEGKTVSIQGFYISKNEVTNAEYHLFLNDLKAKNELEKYNLCLPDTNRWNTEWQSMKAFSDYYFSHPAYADYPVVNVSYEAAQLYCDWLSEKINAANGGELKLKFRLPMREEFIRACKGDQEYQVYAWKENALQNKEGSVLCNFARLGAEDIRYNDSLKKYEVVPAELRFANQTMVGSLNDNADILAPAKSYWPNQFGIYNLNGNASEMTNIKGICVGGDWHSPGYDVRNESHRTYSDPSPTVGFRALATITNR